MLECHTQGWRSSSLTVWRFGVILTPSAKCMLMSLSCGFLVLRVKSSQKQSMTSEHVLRRQSSQSRGKASNQVFLALIYLDCLMQLGALGVGARYADDNVWVRRANDATQPP
ncbi:hypothetical protein F5B22DRAFT_159871 [Xylaria bambusicola]|uniref:uncharacterized protein n=1 Tax=Xylaria bambusicola TaxID=326684 RepID=UPI002008B7DD|nr:uncharacterized protein F5B22DRAFT_159871 [Xylaria bambusicola]KAI0526476.1 hypothetical protein F5B22DRAFT_159871 [Xylaria bambusicola]